MKANKEVCFQKGNVSSVEWERTKDPEVSCFKRSPRPQGSTLTLEPQGLELCGSSQMQLFSQ